MNRSPIRCVPVYYVSELARRHGVIVCRRGREGLSCFGAIRWKTFAGLSWEPDGRFPTLKRLGVPGVQMDRGRGDVFTVRTVGGVGAPSHNRWCLGWRSLPEAMKQRLLSRRFAKRVRGRTSWDAIRLIHERFTSRAWEQGRSSG